MIRPPDQSDRDLVVEVLRQAQQTRRRAAERAAAEVSARADADGKRAAQPDALKVVRIMAQGARCGELADDLERDEVILAERATIEAALTNIVRAGPVPHITDELRENLVGLVRASMPRAGGDAALERSVKAVADVLVALEEAGYLTLAAPEQPAPEVPVPPVPAPAPDNVRPFRPKPTTIAPEPDVDAATLAAEAVLDATFGAGTTIIEEHADPFADRAPLPAGQGDDDDPDPSVDVATSSGFDASVDDSDLGVILEDS